LIKELTSVNIIYHINTVKGFPMKEGCIFKTAKHGKARIVKYSGCYDVEVEFIDTGYKTTTNTSNIKKGSVKDRLLATVCGVGFIGDGRHGTRINGKFSNAYSVWCNILDRCYEYNSRSQRKNYNGCSVDFKWHNYQNFAEWFERSNVNSDPSVNVDKDLLIPGNKVYSENTCVLIPQWLNKFLKLNHDGSVLKMVGVDFLPRASNKNPYRARCVNPFTKKSEHLGLFKSEIDAHKAWKEKKLKHARKLKSKMDSFDARIYKSSVEMIEGVGKQ